MKSIKSIAAALALCVVAPLAYSQTFTVAPASGPGPFTITWSVPGGTGCAAGGIADWSGSVASAGTKQVTPAVGPHTLTIACNVAGPVTKGSVHLRWAAPTQNTDGTAYTNAQGYVIYYDTSTALAKQMQSTLTPTMLDYTIDNLDAGHWYFGIKSLNTAGLYSDMSEIVDKVLDGAPTSTPWTGSATFTMVAPPSKPKAPVLSIVP